jgi:hypothetical protein
MHTFWHANLANVDQIIEYNINSINGKKNEAKKLELEVKVVITI